jgi:hypothetical protein
VWYVEPAPPGLRVLSIRGDRIDLPAMRCIPLDSPRCKSLLSVLGGLGGKQVVLPGREIELVIKQTDGGATRVVRMEAARPTYGWGDRLVLLADTIVAIIVIVAAFRLVWVHPGKITWGFFLYAIWFNPGYPSPTPATTMAGCHIRARDR